MVCIGRLSKQTDNENIAIPTLIKPSVIQYMYIVGIITLKLSVHSDCLLLPCEYIIWFNLTKCMALFV